MSDSKKVPDPKMLELDKWMRNIQLADDHACVLMGVGYVESLLGELLRAKMIAESKVPEAILKDRGPLESLSALRNILPPGGSRSNAPQYNPQTGCDYSGDYSGQKHSRASRLSFA